MIVMMVVYDCWFRTEQKSMLMTELRLKQTATYEKILKVVWHGHAESDCKEQSSELADCLRKKRMLCT
jgi:hypothetical protein